jgi:hypothetical protein
VLILFSVSNFLDPWPNSSWSDTLSATAESMYSRYVSRSAAAMAKAGSHCDFWPVRVIILTRRFFHAKSFQLSQKFS